MREQLRAFRALIAFSLQAARRETILFWISGAVMQLYAPALAYGAKLLVDAAVARDLIAALWASGWLSLAIGIGYLASLYYLDFLFTVAEKASATVNRRLIALMAGVPGLAHHEQPAYLREMDLLREKRGSLGWVANATAGLLRVAIQLVASGILLARIHPVLLLLPLVGLGSFLAGRRARDLQIKADEATAE